MSFRGKTSSGGPDFIPGKVVDTFAHEGIRRRMFQDLLSPSNNVLQAIVTMIHPEL